MSNSTVQRVDYIDALRGLAASMVVVTHTLLLVNGQFSAWFYRLISEGARGVQLFFIISAFTLFLSLDKANYNGERTKTLFYFLRRFFRIAPLFYFMIVLSLTLHFLFPSVAKIMNLDNSLATIITSITFTSGFFPGFFDNLVPTQWTIGVEMLFYVFVPFLFLRLRTMKRAVGAYVILSSFSLLCEMAIIACGGDTTMSWVNTIYPHVYKSLIFQLPVFFLGITYFYCLKEGKRLRDLLPLLYVSVAQTLIFGLYQMYMINKFDLSIISPRIQLTAVIFLFVIMVIAEKNIFSTTVFLKYIGKISYSVYLLHYMTLSIVVQMLKQIPDFVTLSAYAQFFIVSVVGYTLVIMLSSVTYVLVETPGQQLGAYIYKKITTHT